MSMAMVAGSGGANWAEVYKAVHNPDAYSEFKIDLYFYCDTNCGAYWNWRTMARLPEY